jgi:hypothetical protein
MVAGVTNRRWEPRVSELINRDGHVINPDGSLKGDPAGWDAAAWSQSINEAIAAHERRSGEQVDESQLAFVAIERGDWQWKEAEKYGADPARTAYQHNEQFPNPDLIHPGDVMMLRNPAGAPGAVGASGQQGVPDPGARPIPDTVLQPIQAAAAAGDQATVDRLIKEYLDGAATEAERAERFATLQQSPEIWGGDAAKAKVDQGIRNYVTTSVDLLSGGYHSPEAQLEPSAQIGLANTAVAIFRAYLMSLPEGERQSAAQQLYDHDWQHPNDARAWLVEAAEPG